MVQLLRDPSDLYGASARGLHGGWGWASAQLVVPADTLAGGRARGGESHQREHEERDTSHPGGHFRFRMIFNFSQGGPAKTLNKFREVLNTTSHTNIFCLLEFKNIFGL